MVDWKTGRVWWYAICMALNFQGSKIWNNFAKVTSQFVYYHFVYSSLVYCCFVYSTFLLLFASTCSIVIKFWFTKVLMPLVKFWGYSFKEHPLTSYDVQIPKSEFLLFLESSSWKHFFMGHEVLGVAIPDIIWWVFRQKEKSLKTIQENFSNEYSLDEHISALNWVGFRKLQTCMYIASIFHSTLNCTLKLSRAWLTTANSWIDEITVDKVD